MEEDLCRGDSILHCYVRSSLLFPYFLPFWYPYILIHFCLGTEVPRYSAGCVGTWYVRGTYVQGRRQLFWSGTATAHAEGSA